MKELGIIGGLGPLATAYFIELVIKMTNAQCDNEHIPMTIYNKPSIPDRTAYILGKSKKSPIDAMVFWAKSLSDQEVDCIAIPCVTAHLFYEEIARAVNVPVINIVRETATYLEERKIKRVGLLATDGTIFSGFFQKELEDRGINVTLPSSSGQQKMMDIVYKGLKADNDFSMNDFYDVEKELKDKDVQVIVLGCTELSLLIRNQMIGKGFLDATAVLASKSVQFCSNNLKNEYINLIT